jgi:outer membrane receptor for ferrienterochelin and colicin
MLRSFILLIIGVLCTTIAISQTTIQGKITETGTGEPVLFAAVALYKNDVLITGAESDFDGNYSFTDVSPGTYDIEASFVGLQSQKLVGVVAKDGKVNIVNIEMEQASVLATQEEIVIKEYKVPLVEFDNTTQGQSLTSESIQNLPTKNISAIAATSAGVSVDNGGNISIRGSRSNATNYYIDGVRVSAASAGNSIPQAQIEQMQIITGGIEARYGDVTGGIISITSKGPSNKFTGGVELETSQYLDDFGYNLVNANLSGPILRNKEGESILGFRFFGQYRNIQDDSPSAVGNYRASEALIDELEANPVTSLNGTLFPAAQFVSERDLDNPARVDFLKADLNEADRDINMSGNIDARISKNVDVSFSGSYFDSKNQFTPTRAWSLYNWRNNPFGYFSGYRANIKLRHKLGNQNFDAQSMEDRKDQVIRNASYSIQVGYEKTQNRGEDVRHQDNIFNYGYHGVQPRSWVPQASFLSDPASWGGEAIDIGGGALFAHQGYLELSDESEFVVDPNINPVLGQMNPENGFLEPIVNDVWGLFSNVGAVFNSFTKSEDEILTVNVLSGFDFTPGGSEKGKHSIQFGFMYEQRTNRSYSLQPRRLWQLMRLEANRHLNGVDTTNAIGTFDAFGQQFTQYAPGNSVGGLDDAANNSFLFNIRRLTGQAIDEYVNVDALNPNDLDLSLFSPEELNNLGILDYVGYDYLGNKTSSSTTFNDFFTGQDANGNNTFLVAPWTPIYGAGFIQDKFTYKDIIFRLGLRVDYYDANSKVLRDPFSLNRIEEAGDFFSRNLDQQQPGSVGDDYKVYLAGENSTQVVGYRLGEQWFRPDGTATDGNLLFGGGLITPSYVETDLASRDPQSETFNVDESFQDYDPQLNFMPRLAFSFPISEDAGFFAHYDILVQRPPSNFITTGLDYYYFNSGARFNLNGNPANNPDLRPEKTIDYEVGFQQKISNSSAIKVSAYYKELRDMIQARFFQFVPNVTQYQTYGNLDFGTVKGFSFAYDLRRTGNFQLNATYTLQFADGSGSTANSAAGFNPNVSIRTLLPLSFDERHRITTVADYRYGSGKSYNGPRIGNTDIFANTGFNLLLTGISGRPYSTFRNVTAPLTSTVRENINGARLPWVLNADVQIDKNFQFKLSEDSQRYLGVNVYIRIQNILDRDNITGVYNVSGDPDSDGFLLSTFGEQRLQQIEDTNLDAQSFLSHYDWRILNPAFFSNPRQIFLGAIVNF